MQTPNHPPPSRYGFLRPDRIESRASRPSRSGRCSSGSPSYGASPSIPSPYKTQRKKVKALDTCCTMLIALTTVWLVGLVVSYADARLPPKFLKATNNVGKIYAGRYGYSLVPAAPKFLVQASVDRKVVHVPVPVLRPARNKRRPLSRRPPAGPPEYGFNDYPAAASKTHPRLRKPPRYRAKPRPPPREPEYYEQEVEDDLEDFNDYDYEDRRLEKQKRYEDRPFKRGYSSSSNGKAPYEETRPKPFSDSRYKRPYEEEEEFLAQHSELYASGYSGGKPKSRPTRTRDEDEPPRKYKPFNKGSKGPTPTRPTNKLYSASFPPSRKPAYPRDEDRYRYEEEEEEDDAIQRPRYKKRQKYSEEDYDDLPQEKEDQIKESNYRPSGPPEEFDFNPDSFYHDRKFEPKQKAKRGTEDKGNNSKPRPHRPSKSEENLKPFPPSAPGDNRRRPERKEPPSRRNKDITKTQQEEQREEPKKNKKSKWSIPYRLEDEEEEWDHRGAGTSEKPPTQQETIQNLVTIRPKTTGEKPVNGHSSTAQSSWPVIVQGLSWKDAPHPAFVENHPAGFMSDWQDFKIPQWPNVDEQLGQFPESLRSTFKWVEPTNQTPVNSKITSSNHRTTTQAPIVIPPVDYPSRGIGPSNNDSRKKKSSKRGQKDRSRDGNNDIVAQRVVGGTLQLNGAFKPDQTNSETWVNPAFRSATKTPGRSPQQQYTVEMFKSVEPGKPFEGEIVYGTRITDSKSKLSSIEPDIGYHSGMETVEDDIGGWQVY